jgi:hypothetical protein
MGIFDDDAGAQKTIADRIGSLPLLIVAEGRP